MEVAKHIKPSARGELEITTVNQEFLKDKLLKVQTMARGFAWLDTGTHDSLSEASTFIEVLEKRQGLKVACLEGIAYRQGWIDSDTLRKNAQPMLKKQKGRYTNVGMPSTVLCVIPQAVQGTSTEVTVAESSVLRLSNSGR